MSEVFLDRRKRVNTFKPATKKKTEKIDDEFGVENPFKNRKKTTIKLK